MVIKHGTTLVTVGEGTVFLRIGLNADNEGLFLMYGTSHPSPIGGGTRPLEDSDIPPDIDLEAPDIAMRVTNVAGLNAMIETLQCLKEIMEEEATNDE